MVQLMNRNYIFLAIAHPGVNQNGSFEKNLKVKYFLIRLLLLHIQRI